MTDKVIKTQFGEFTSEQIKELLSTELGRKVRTTLSSEKKLERDKKAAEAKAKLEREKQQVEMLIAASGLTIPENVFIKKIGVTNKSDTYKDVYINFRIDDDTPHVLTIPVSGDVDTQENLNIFADRIMKAKLHLLLLVSKLG
jgi:nitrogenase molybdenum-iron protein alpha/beta subunit